VSSETSAIRTQTPGNYPKRNKLHLEHGESLKTRSKYVIIAGNLGSGGSGSSVGLATGYGLNGPGTESRWGARFSAPVQTGPGAHPASCTMRTESFPEVEAAGAWG